MPVTATRNWDSAVSRSGQVKDVRVAPDGAHVSDTAPLRIPGEGRKPDVSRNRTGLAQSPGQ